MSNLTGCCHRKFTFDFVYVVFIITSSVTMNNIQYSIKVAANRSGLTPHVIRVWERRYGAVEPDRTGTNRRLYSDAEIERLSLLRHAIAAGHRIGNIARLDRDQLRSIVGDSLTTSSPPPTRPANAHGHDPHRLIEECLEAVRKMDNALFEETLTRGLVLLGHQGLLRKVIAPLTQSIGELWREGSLAAAHEHLASASLRVFLTNASRPYAQPASAPLLIVTTPSGQLHELGAVIISSAARNAGWNVAFLGTSLPAAEIAGAAVQKNARAVALSIVYPSDDPSLPAELELLRKLLPRQTAIITGGRAAEAYREVLDRIQASFITDLEDFARALDRLRLPPSRTEPPAEAG
jgi:MerR family transcriptional regulator, light-induced transcriptional regulator